MWDNIRMQVKDLFKSTGQTSQDVATYLSQTYEMNVHPSEIRHAVNSEQGTGKKGRELLKLTHRYLTEIQESQNREISQQIRRAEKALNNAQ